MWGPVSYEFGRGVFYLFIYVLPIAAILLHIYARVTRKSLSKELSNALSDDDKTRIFRELNEDAINPPKCPQCRLPSSYLNENTNQYQLEAPPGYQIKLLRNLSIFCLKCDLGMRG